VRTWGAVTGRRPRGASGGEGHNINGFKRLEVNLAAMSIELAPRRPDNDQAHMPCPLEELHVPESLAAGRVRWSAGFGLLA
jgi:hypothetical protein